MVRFLLFACLLILAACDDYPKDVKATLQKVQNHQALRVGLIEHEPWVVRGASEPQGIEVEIITDFAQNLNAATHWTFLSEAEATEKLKNHELDLVVGGLTQDSPRKKEVGFTRPYLKTGGDKKDRHVMAAPQGENRFIITLEKFLKAHKSEIHKIYQREQRL